MARPNSSRRFRIKKALAERDGMVCHYCKRELTPETRTTDHVIPLYNGGTNRLDNLVQSCYDCNHAKGNMTYEAFSLLSYHKSIPSARICLGDVLAELTCSQQVARE